MKIKNLVAVGILTWASAGLADAGDVAGRWRTIDDGTKKPKSIVEITKVGDLYEGKVVELFRGPGEEANPKCTECKDALKDQPVLGLKILQDLKKRKSDWGDGTILDPKNGKTYDVKMELAEQGTRLKVRGFIGFSLLGRTQTWERVP